MENTKECRNEHSMNSGWIYRELCKDWKKYPRYLFSEIEKKLEYILIGNKKESVILTWEANRGYIEKSLREEKHYQERIKDNKNPPYTEFFMLSQKGGDEYYLIEYGSNFLLTYENDKSYFDFFFAIKLLVTDEMKLKEFLTHQLQVNFKDNSNQYKEFLETVLIKYREFLVNGKIDVIVNKFIAEHIEKTKNQAIGNLQPTQTKATDEPLLPKIEKPTQKKKKSKAKKKKPIELGELFSSKKDFTNCINTLKTIEPPVIDDLFNYRLGERQKGAIVAWVQAVKQRGKLKIVKDESLALLLNRKIKNLNLAKDGRTLRNTGTTAYKKYFNKFLNLIS